ncbi:hypothetical protein CCQ97_21340 [Salmonella enterica]|nr:hypothetical protein [Salmonella enterica]EAZ2191378.1 hypothetical protein [Salmonella enterica]EBR7720478.1 hypothetical protein [Salmonella enterica]EBR7729491.1 hypothetical protein [Salmonella enterica]EBR7867628.1 hypothetical protein [Salmonella enterica]
MPELDLKQTIAGETPETDSAERNAHAQSLGCECEYCGYPSGHNTAIHRDGNPLNRDDSNLTVVDPFCRAWRELNTLNADNAVMALLPGISSVDISHLQRTIHIALHCDDAATRADAASYWTGSPNITHSPKSVSTRHIRARLRRRCTGQPPRNVMKPGWHGVISHRYSTRPVCLTPQS